MGGFSLTRGVIRISLFLISFFFFRPGDNASAFDGGKEGERKVCVCSGG